MKRFAIAAALMLVLAFPAQGAIAGGHAKVTGDASWFASGQRHVVFNAHDNAPGKGGPADRGTLLYENLDEGWYFKTDVTCVDIASPTQAYMTVVFTESTWGPWPAGSIFHASVADNGEPGIGADQIIFSQAGGSIGPCGGWDATGFAIAEGNIQIHP